MICPDCQSAMQYMNQDYVSHGYYCPKVGCGRWVRCDKDCCQIEKIDRRNRDVKPRPNMVWSDRHNMWVDPDTRTPEQRARDQAIAARLEEEAAALRKPLEEMTPEEKALWNNGSRAIFMELKKRREARDQTS